MATLVPQLSSTSTPVLVNNRFLRIIYLSFGWINIIVGPATVALVICTGVAFFWNIPLGIVGAALTLSAIIFLRAPESKRNIDRPWVLALRIVLMGILAYVLYILVSDAGADRDDTVACTLSSALAADVFGSFVLLLFLSYARRKGMRPQPLFYGMILE